MNEIVMRDIETLIQMKAKVLPLAKPYPKRASCGITSDSAGPAPTGQGGASPTMPLQLIPATLPQVAG